MARPQGRAFVMAAKEKGTNMCSFRELRVQGTLMGPDEATVIYESCADSREYWYTWELGPFEDLREVYVTCREIVAQAHSS